jgi:pyruvate kinase
MLSPGNDCRHTKIICTIGPASSSRESLRELILAGMDSARLNFSHGSSSEHAEKIHAIRDVSEELGKPVAILQDLAGPKIRVGHIPDPGIRLDAGEIFILTTETLEGNDERVSVTDPCLPEEVDPGDVILLADGLMELKVIQVKHSEIHCEVITGGVLTSNKGINLPTGTIRLPSITDKDREDLYFGLENGVDYIALSFVRTAQDVLEVKEIIKRRGKDTPVIAKIEKHEAISNIEDIIGISDGIMVARGDLGVEIPLESVPVIQKQLIQIANRNGKPVIIATQMLRSMVNSPRPTRAEATDIANAVLDGTDAIMLSEETAVGDYPVKAVQFMARIAINSEAIYPHDSYLHIIPENKTSESVAYASCVLADHLKASAIIAPTRSGRTAAHLSRFRPRCNIIALSPNLSTVQRISLYRGCVPRLLPEAGENDIIEKASAAALKTGLVGKGDLVVITSGQPGTSTDTNMIRVVRL